MSQRNSNVPGDEQIRLRAYEIYAESGYVDSRDEENWLRAEEELKNQSPPTRAPQRIHGNRRTGAVGWLTIDERGRPGARGGRPPLKARRLQGVRAHILRIRGYRIGRNRPTVTLLTWRTVPFGTLCVLPLIGSFRIISRRIFQTKRNAGCNICSDTGRHAGTRRHTAQENHVSLTGAPNPPGKTDTCGKGAF